MTKRMSVAEQKRRASEIEATAAKRPLTRAELDEYDNLAHRSYMRAWRAQQDALYGRGWAR